METTRHQAAHHDSILVGVDGSDAGAAAVRYAAQEARRLGCGIRLVHVAPLQTPLTPMTPMFPVMAPDFAPVGRRVLHEASEQARALLPLTRVTTSLLEGSCVEVLEEQAEGAILLVLGCESRSTLERLVTGAKVAALASRASCSVVAVPAGWRPGVTHNCVVVGVTSTKRSASASLLLRALRTASDRHAGLVVLHAWKLPEGYEDVIAGRVDQQEWTDRTRRFIEHDLADVRVGYPDVSVEVQVVNGQAARALQIASRNADLLLLARRNGAFPLGHLGGIGRALLRESYCPVEVVPAAGETSDATDLVLEREGAMVR